MASDTDSPCLWVTDFHNEGTAKAKITIAAAPWPRNINGPPLKIICNDKNRPQIK